MKTNNLLTKHPTYSMQISFFCFLVIFFFPIYFNKVRNCEFLKR